MKKSLVRGCHSSALDVDTFIAECQSMGAIVKGLLPVLPGNFPTDTQRRKVLKF